MSDNKKKELLFQAGLKLFGEYSPKRVSIDMIVKEAGVAKGTFYLYYKNKEELYEDIVNTILSNGSRSITQLASNVPDVKKRFLINMIGTLEFLNSNGIVKNLMTQNKDYFVGNVNFDTLYAKHLEFMKILIGDHSNEEEFVDMVSNIKGFYVSTISSCTYFTTEEEYKDFALKLAIVLVEGMFNFKNSNYNQLTYDDFTEEFRSNLILNKQTGEK